MGLSKTPIKSQAVASASAARSLILPDLNALFNPETSILIQKRHPYTGNLNSETLGDSKNAFLHWGDVLGFPNIW